MNANIPFFTDLPPKAVKAACGLWDKIRSPDYNGITAYHDFCRDLLTAAITPPPPRAIVKRWAAGVQAGLIERPKTKAERAEEQRAVDEARAKFAAIDRPVADNSSAAEVDAPSPCAPSPKGKAERKARMKADVLVTDEAVGVPFHPTVSMAIEPDTRHISNLSVSDRLKMPAAVDMAFARATPLAVGDSGLVENASALLDAISSSTPIVSPPGSTLQFQEQPALLAVRTAAGRLLEETIIQLSQGIERTARDSTARMLRDVADEMERSPS